MPGRLAIIPARGGSKRLPGKNIADFQGKPIIAWTYEAALESQCFDSILISTEDRAIASVAETLGATVSMRDPSLATDSASLIDVGIDILDREEAEGRSYDVISFLYATSPLRRAEDIWEVIRLIKPGVCDYAMAITRYAHPPHQGLVMQEDGVLTPRWNEYIENSEAEFGRLWVDNGSTYAVTVPAFREKRTFYGENLRAWPMPFIRSVDIDEQEDLELARVLAGSLSG